MPTADPDAGEVTEYLNSFALGKPPAGVAGPFKKACAYKSTGDFSTINYLTRADVEKIMRAIQRKPNIPIFAKGIIDFLPSAIMDSGSSYGLESHTCTDWVSMDIVEQFATDENIPTDIQEKELRKNYLPALIKFLNFEAACNEETNGVEEQLIDPIVTDQHFYRLAMYSAVLISATLAIWLQLTDWRKSQEDENFFSL